MKSTVVCQLVVLVFLIQHAIGQVVPPKCCDPMLMPVSGKCKEVSCNYDSHCTQYKAYCAKYNKGQPLCRGSSYVCGCNGERSKLDKKPTGLNCPTNHTCDGNGKCMLTEQKCYADQVPFQNQCQTRGCTTNAQCSQYKGYCTKFKIGSPVCRPSTKVCGCNGEAAVKPCDRRLNGNTKCDKGQECYPDGKCGPPSTCAFDGDVCDPKKKKCCSSTGVYCHKPKIGGYSCLRQAKVGENCSSGIPCDKTSRCADGICTLIQPRCGRDQVAVQGTCRKKTCDRDADCSEFRGYCAQHKIGYPLCRPNSKICGCNGEQSSNDVAISTSPKPCNRELNGNEKCPKGQVCYPSGKCGSPPNCAFNGDKCDLKKNKCCSELVYCHKRKLNSFYSCVLQAHVGDDCTSGIPCEGSSVCVKGKCSLRINDECDVKDNVCPPNTECFHVPQDTGKQKMCQERKGKTAT